MIMKEAISILVVDDEPIVRESLGSWFRQDGFSVDLAQSGREALEKLTAGLWDIFLIDIKMPQMDGLELQRKIKEINPEATIIIMTAYASVETAVEAMKQGAYDYIIKPFDPENLELLIRNALERKQLVKENVQLKQKIDEMCRFNEIIGKSEPIQRVMEQVNLVSQSNTTVLLRGASGTGKELIARAIHANSPRRYMPIVVVNCGALSEGILESELFGHEKGAFTGAQYRRKGKLEMADGGTLFLDEIGDISLKTQVDLLRVLEERKISRVGGNTQIPVDFRLVAATNRNLEAFVAEGRFREDLYYRLNVFSITLPPLHERQEDIPPIAEHFLQKFSQNMNKPVVEFSKEAMAMLVAYEWPGNIRELQNAIERAVLICKTKKIQCEDLPFHTTKIEETQTSKALSAVEREHIKRVLDATDGNISQAARLLEIDRVTLYNKMKKFDLKQQ